MRRVDVGNFVMGYNLIKVQVIINSNQVYHDNIDSLYNFYILFLYYYLFYFDIDELLLLSSMYLYLCLISNFLQQICILFEVTIINFGV